MPDQRGIQAALSDPSTAHPSTLLHLQRTGGNRAVGELLQRHGIQARLQVGAADDALEAEADRVATAVVRDGPGDREAPVQGARGLPQAAAPTISHAMPLAQRHTPDPKPGEDADDTDDDETMQRSSDGSRRDSFDAGAAIESTLDRRAGSGRPLDASVQRDMEERFGAGFGDVRVHDDAVAASLNRDVGATAFTRGRDIYFGGGELDASSPKGRHLLAHELTHVVQQGGGRTGPAVQRANVGRGEQLPDLNQAADQRLAEGLHKDASLQVVTGAQMVRKLLQAVKTDASLRAALGNGATGLSDDALRDVRAAYLDPLRTAVAKLKAGATAARGGQPTGDATAIAIEIETDVSDALRAKFKGQDLLDRKRVVNGLRNVVGDRSLAARELFDQARGDVKLGPAYLPDDQRASFSAALKLLPTVRMLLAPGGAQVGASLGGGGAAGQGGAQAQVAQWQDGGKLADKVIVKPSKGIPAWLSSRRASKQIDKFKRKVDSVDAWVRAMLEPEILRRVPRPEMVMHTRGRMKTLGSARKFVFLPDATGYRPNFGDGQVNLSYNETFGLIAHEVGHAIEGFLPIKSWHDMNLLLERRHEDKVGTSRGARTGATMWTSGVVNFGPLENEGRYAGRYVTGKYTSTAYDDGGNAEVFSQAMEFFSKPSEALQLIEGDPQHAAIVLRSIRPAEYAALAALRAFDKFLPIKGGRG